VPGVAGTWKDLTDNVNQLAANLTTQVRAIAEVATAVTKGDLTRSVMVRARGEVAALKDNINEMIRNLADTTRKNTEQDWLKTNLAKFSRMLQGQRDLAAVSRLILSELAPLVDAQQGVLYVQTGHAEERRLELLASYACESAMKLPQTLRIGEGLAGQCANDRKTILLTDLPHDYVRIGSVLGNARPAAVIVLPVPFEGQVKAVIELASLRRFSQTHLTFLEQLTESIGIVFNTIEANMRTEGLLQQSQSLTRELQRTNEELQEKAEQLALNSRYKSEFLANMSHELRTPLNSLLILARLLADNTQANLTPKQIEHANAIHAAGTDLLSLINDILDLAKIESGTVTLDITPVPFAEVQGYVERTFRQVAHDKGLDFKISMSPELPPEIRTDAKRLQQILKNLLSNAFKFTLRGSVALEVALTSGGHPLARESSATAEKRLGKVVAFSVIDTGIGIAPDKQRIIFEAFQQADGTTSRQFGGTGLGLSISSELARLLGGEIGVVSSPGRGSTFTLYLPSAIGSNGAGGNGVASLRRRTESTGQADKGRQTPAAAHRKASAEQLPIRLRTGLSGRKALIVDDDARNVFALTSALEQQGMAVLSAENGVGGIEALKNNPDVDIVLMDMMMPDIDGHDTIRIIRGLERFRNVPIISVTAQAMKGDRDRCIEAGASDYIAKPVNLDELLSLMQAWICR
jgi:signal transduction histidine kinase/HAMP domain-containing protein